MKCCLLILLVISLQAQAQQKQQHFANTYSYMAEDGFTEANYRTLQQLPDGRLFVDNYGNFTKPVLIGNNSFQLLPALSPYSNIASTLTSYAPNAHTIWIRTQQDIFRLAGDSIRHLLHTGNAGDYGLPAHGGIYYGIYKSGQPPGQAFFYNGTSLQPLHWGKYFTDTVDYALIAGTDGNLWAYQIIPGSLILYRVDSASHLPVLIKKYAIRLAEGDHIAGIRDENNFLIRFHRDMYRLLLVKDGQLRPSLSPEKVNTENGIFPFVVSDADDGQYRLHNLLDTAIAPVHFESKSGFTRLVLQLPGTASFIVSTDNKPMRVFLLLQYYPSLFYNGYSGAINTVRQGADGSIYAGSYNGFISIIKGNTIIHSLTPNTRWLNGGSSLPGNMFFISEEQGLKKILPGGQVLPVNNNSGSTGFYSYVSRDSRYFYYGKEGYKGVWRCTTASLDAGQPVWDIIDSSKGAKLFNVLTITEDTLGRIWFAHPGFGVGIIPAGSSRATTWLLQEKQTSFGAMASLTDSSGTVWLGGSQGLWYYNDYTKPATPQSCANIRHPLLQTGKIISALTICGHWLLIAATDKMLALNLREFHTSGKVVLRYLNPQESNFSAPTEQNTLITAQDSSVWFSTSNMLYHWDFTNWIKLPTYKVQISCPLITGSQKTMLQAGQALILERGINTFDIQVQMLSPDVMPRYMQVAFIKDGDSVVLPVPSLQSRFPIQNTARGSYTFYVNVFEQDGTTTHYAYKIEVRPFITQTIWFWLLIAALFMLPLVLWINSLRRQAVQQKRMAQLNIVTLSNQFRPHFILNALNTIGAELYDKPAAEAVISRLGESIDLIFNHAQQRRTAHTLQEEWLLVQNVIEIHRLMYLPALETTLPPAEWMQQYSSIRLPLGILQIPVENALLHGLRNKRSGPYRLIITAAATADAIILTITDNGIGRSRSMGISSYKKHGSGVKNLADILLILNRRNREKITITYTDDVFPCETDTGTQVTIGIPTRFQYE